jgi:hypothetical protein
MRTMDTTNNNSSSNHQEEKEEEEAHHDHDHDHSEKRRRPLYIFLLSGQSNMVGRGHVEHMNLLIHPNETTTHTSNHSTVFRKSLWNKTSHSYRTTNQVYLLDVASLLSKEGYLGMDPVNGTAFAYKPGHFGPELMMGWTLLVAAHTQSKVLLIRCAWGGKSLFRAFKPPCAGRRNAGHLYKELIHRIQTALGNLSQILPNDFYYDPQYDEAEVAGFFWHQGWDDLPNESATAYQSNLECLIQDIRKEFDAPKLPLFRLFKYLM